MHNPGYWAPRRTARVRLRGPSLHALSSRRLRPFVTTTYAQTGLTFRIALLYLIGNLSVTGWTDSHLQVDCYRFD